jgi:hypothetical protein
MAPDVFGFVGFTGVRRYVGRMGSLAIIRTGRKFILLGRLDHLPGCNMAGVSNFPAERFSATFDNVAAHCRLTNDG